MAKYGAYARSMREDGGNTFENAREQARKRQQAQADAVAASKGQDAVAVTPRDNAGRAMGPPKGVSMSDMAKALRKKDPDRNGNRKSRVF